MMNGKKTEPEEPLSRESEPLYRQAAEILRDRILKGEYPPGTMIPSERELGNSLGISRIPIRDAIKSLQYIGIVNQVKGKGVVVQKLDPGQVLAKVGPFLASPGLKTLIDLLDIRIAVEQVSVREAARKGTPEDFDELSRLIAVLRSEASEKEKEDAGRQFHLKIAEIGDNHKTVFITGSSGFIGSNLAKRILTTEPDTKVIGLDNMNDYYDVRIKEARLAELQKFENYTFIKGNLADKALINSIFEQYHPDIVVNLGAQAGVRYSITNPDAYIESNMIGFYNILEACRHYPVEHLVYASSSSVYGSNKKVPYSTDDKVDNPVSLYAATKKSNELMAHAYSKLYNIPSTGLRFFTVYGPAGRPDMAYFGFTNKLVNGETIKIFNYGNCKRDFTYVDDIVEGVVRVMAKAPEKKNGEDGLPIPPYAVYNIGNSNPENLLDFVQILSEELVRAGVLPADYDFEAHKELVPMQPGDVPVTFADTEPLERDFGFKPHTPLREGLRKFAEWYKEFYME